MGEFQRVLKENPQGIFYGRSCVPPEQDPPRKSNMSPRELNHCSTHCIGTIPKIKQEASCLTAQAVSVIEFIKANNTKRNGSEKT